MMVIFLYCDLFMMDHLNLVMANLLMPTLRSMQAPCNDKKTFKVLTKMALRQIQLLDQKRTSKRLLPQILQQALQILALPD